MKKIGLWPIVINPGVNWNRDYICDSCGHRTFIPAGNQLVAPWVRCILTGKLECPNCHARCVKKYAPELAPNNGHGETQRTPEPPRGKYARTVRETGGIPEAPK